ncbi:hypothetical protein AC578_929 [Pseudocercospora eumusae]|uniref:Uncharacterized protein n=1 Tax=Pseudocercospora eumusae TaxID=321146 RepID=A0A139HC35_9PEZI|nr:hypothetical protein AC578_929 [Pseudocercospora eumusae]
MSFETARSWFSSTPSAATAQDAATIDLLFLRSSIAEMKQSFHARHQLLTADGKSHITIPLRSTAR